MKKSLIFILLFTFLIFNYQGFSQSNKYLFVDKCNDIIQTADSSYIGIGNTKHYNIDKFWIVKYNKNGDLQWEKKISEGRASFGNSISFTSDSGYISVGMTLKDSIYPFIIKFNDNGKIEWKKTVNEFSVNEIYSVVQTKDKGFIILGQTKIDNRNRLFILKTDEQGKYSWINYIDDGKVASGYIRRIGSKIIETNNGEFAITGHKILLSDGSSKTWLIKLNEKGEKIWEETYSELSAPKLLHLNSNGFEIVGLSQKNKIQEKQIIKINLNKTGNKLNSTIISNQVRESVSVLVKTNNSYKITGISKLSGFTNIDFWAINTTLRQPSAIRVISFKRIGEYKLDNENKKLIDDLINSTSNISHLLLEGYADAMGDKITNIKLSKRRINTVKYYLTKNGVTKNNIVVQSVGETFSVQTDETTKKGSLEDRKVIIKIYKN